MAHVHAHSHTSDPCLDPVKAAQERLESPVSEVLQNRGPISAGPLVNGWIAPKLIGLTNVVYI